MSGEMATAVRSWASWSASQDMAPWTTVPVEPPSSEAGSREAVAGAHRVQFFDHHHVIDQGLVELRRPHAHAESRDQAGGRLAAERDRSCGVDRDNPDIGPVLTEVPRATHQGPRCPGSHEQHVQFGELIGDLGGSPAVVRSPVAGIGVLVEPDVPLVGRAQVPHVVEPGPEEAVDGIRFGDQVHLCPERLHELPGWPGCSADRSHTRSGIPCWRRSC